MSEKSSQVKSRQRVADHGEVFTAEREVKAMCDLVDSECRRTEATFLEPACGDGNFLAEILTRKLSAIHDLPDYERKSLIALSTLYGIDILDDNVEICRKRLFDIWDSSYSHSDEAKNTANHILALNIVRGDTLKPKDIRFHEWTFTEGSIIPEQHPFTLASLIDQQLGLGLEED